MATAMFRCKALKQAHTRNILQTRDHRTFLGPPVVVHGLMLKDLEVLPVHNQYPTLQPVL